MSVWKDNSSAVIFIASSIGEIDYLLPVINRYHRSLKKVKFVFFNYENYKKFQFSDPYPKVADELGIEIECFDVDEATRYKPLFSLSLWLFLIKVIVRYNYVHIEQAGGRAMGRMIVLISLILRKKILVHPHATNIEVGIESKKRSRFITSFPILLADDALRKVYAEQGFRSFVKIGFPKFYPEWKNRVLIAANELSGYALLFSRPVDQVWMPEDLYKYLLSTSVKLVRKHFPSIEIVIKTHPRECAKELRETLGNLDRENIRISSMSSLLLAKNCEFAIGFFTSAVFDAYSFEKPAIDFYQEREAMRRWYKNGRSNALLRLDCASNEEELENFLVKVSKKDYRLPDLVKRMHSHSSNIYT